MDTRYVSTISEALGLKERQVSQVFNLLKEGASIPFIARYRKEATGNLDEVKIAGVWEQIGYYTELGKRKDTILKTIEALGKLTSELKQRIENCVEAAVLEDLYLPYKPKRKTRATLATEKGLEPLARSLLNQPGGDPADLASAYISDTVSGAEQALQGARDIIAEWVNENEQARNSIRRQYTGSARLTARILSSKKQHPEAQKYRDYFEFSEPLVSCPSHRLLAIRRGEKEGFLLMDIRIPRDAALDSLSALFIRQSNSCAEQVRIAIEDGFDRLLQPSIETEFRLISKKRADEEAIRVFSENLRQLLLASPLGARRILALDPGFRTGCKLVCLDEQGSLLEHTTIYPHPPQQETEKSTQMLISLAERYDIEAIAVGNGTAGRETEQFVRGLNWNRPVPVFQVSESGASIYSASGLAREEFPDLDLTVRGAISIGRRLADPLSELVKIDPKSIGVGQYQHDVNQVKLKEALDRVVESAVNYVGVDLNTASRHLLTYVSGLNAALARNIVLFRKERGPFRNRQQLLKVPLMGPKTFEQCAGFLRIPGSDNPLDNSSVHPESYRVVEQMAADLQSTVAELLQQPELRRKIDRKKYIGEKLGEFTIEDILKELEKPGRDPRPPITEFRFDEQIRSIGDLKAGMRVPGIVTNITNFGAFVDIGVKQDGLVHISQMSSRYIADPNEVVKLQQTVMVTIQEVDIARNRISLSMKEKPGSGEPHQPLDQRPLKSGKPDGTSAGDFHTRLAELKKKFETGK